MGDISAIILSYNEQLHIERCIESVLSITDNIFVVDCHSTDKTAEIAESLGAKVYFNKWPGLYALQFNWALENLPIRTKWILRLDADEFLTEELISEINLGLEDISKDVSGIIIKRRHVFLNKWVKHGVYPVKLLRIFRFGDGFCEQRFMDEHITLRQGKAIEFKYDFVDHNLNDLGWWTQKHNGYAVREAIDLLDKEYNISSAVKTNENHKIGTQAARKRSVKSRYIRMPLFLRSFLYFFYRYFVRLGFLDGKEGFLWHFLQGWWYRSLVDARIWEVRRACGNDREKIRKYIKDNFHYEI